MRSKVRPALRKDKYAPRLWRQRLEGRLRAKIANDGLFENDWHDHFLWLPVRVPVSADLTPNDFYPCYQWVWLEVMQRACGYALYNEAESELAAYWKLVQIYREVDHVSGPNYKEAFTPKPKVAGYKRVHHTRP